MLFVPSQLVFSARRRVATARFALLIVGSFPTILMIFSLSAYADPDGSDFGWRQAWSGFDIQAGDWLSYAGITVAPMAPDVHTDGIRVRITGGYGQSQGAFQQPASYADSGIFVDDPDQEIRQKTFKFRSRQTYGEALVGYQKKFDNLTAKLFGGVAYIEHRHRGDNGSKDAVEDWGPKGVIELWLDLGDSQWTSLDASHTTAFDSTALRWRYGVKILSSLSVGPELRYDDSKIQTFRSARIGGFIRNEWSWGEASIAAGYSDQLDGWDRAEPSKFDDRRGGYATVNFMVNF